MGFTWIPSRNVVRCPVTPAAPWFLGTRGGDVTEIGLTQDLDEMLRAAWDSQESHPGGLVFGDMPRGMSLEAIAWHDIRQSSGREIHHLGASALRFLGVQRRFGDRGVDLRAAAGHLHHTPPQFFRGSDRGFTRRYLPVYGETDEDRALRSARSMPRFGAWVFGKKGYAWYLNPRCSDDWRSRLFWFLDGHRDAYDQSLDEANWYLASVAPDAVEEDVRSVDGMPASAATEWLELHENFCSEIRAHLDELGEEWLADVSGGPIGPHVCGLMPIDTPDVGGVYFLRSRAPTDSAIKIGWAKESIRRRVRDLQTAHPWPLELLAFIPGASLLDETAMHRRFAALRLETAPGKEWFEPEADLMQEILRLRGVQ